MKRVLVNALPKSGTHLLATAVAQCGFHEHFDIDNVDDTTRVAPFFFNYREVKNGLARLGKSEVKPSEQAVCVGTLTPVYIDLQTMQYWLEAIPLGNYALGHIAYSPVLAQLLEQLDYRHVFIIRDPRAVITSLLSFILDTRGMPKPHFLEADFLTMSAEQRLTLLLEGGDAPIAGVRVRGFADVFHSMLTWRDDPNCLFVKFEELVGAQGGGDEAVQAATIRRIQTHLGVSSAELPSIYDPNARTFRKGSITSWQTAHDPRTLAKLNNFCQPLCEAAGYEP